MIYYRIDGDNNVFRTLRDAKHHVWIAYTPNERLKYLQGSCIVKFINDEAATLTPIIVNENGYTFGKTIKIEKIYG